MPPSGTHGEPHSSLPVTQVKNEVRASFVGGENGNLVSLQHENSKGSQEAGAVNPSSADGGTLLYQVLFSAPHLMMVADRSEDAHGSGWCGD